MKGQHDAVLTRAIADDVGEEPHAVRCPVLDSTTGDGSGRGRQRGGRLEHNTLLEAPEQEHQPYITEPKADQNPRSDLSHSRSCQLSAGSSVGTRRAI